MRRAFAPLAAGLLGLTGALAATLFLYRAADRALVRMLDERLRGAGETAAGLLSRAPATPEALGAIMRANELEGAYLLSPTLEVLADATGPAGVTADLLRVDHARVDRAFVGEPTIAFGYALGDQPIATGYFPVNGPEGSVRAVLALEAGQSFAAGRAQLRRALWIGVLLSALAAFALAAAALQWARSEAHRRETAERAARGDALARMAAMVAHEVRNPLGIIKGSAELIRARGAAALGPEDDEALQDLLGEVERLKRLTQDFLDLAREPVLVTSRIDLAEVAGEARRALAHRHASVAVRLDVPPLPVEADADRLRQVLANLLLNAAQAGAREIAIRGAATEGFARIEIRDDGGGVDAALKTRLFEPFATGRAEGTGLGLAIARSIAVRHGGTLTLVEDGRPGTAFALRLPLAPG
ncbi:MAG TPA: HAMP domain-containing sensor histidine kinase [Anaeromyxobacter sp.]